MAISRQAIERFLWQPPMWLPKFRDATPAELDRRIYDCTGAYFKPKTKPRSYQLEAVAFALFCRRALLYLDMRMGKTKVALDWAEHLRRAKIWREGKGLIIAHSPDGLPVWEHETALHSNLTLRSVHLDFDELCDALDSDCDLICIPWSGLQQLMTKVGTNRKGEPKLYPERELISILAEHFTLAIFDEVHFTKNHLSLRFNIASPLTANCKYITGLSGTPYGRNPLDLWAQAFMVDRGKTLGINYYFFEQAFGVKTRDPWMGDKWKFDKRKFKTLDHKLSQIAIVYSRKKYVKETVHSGVINLHMRSDQLEAYGDVLNRLVKINQKDRLELGATFMKLRQVSSGYLPYEIDGVRHVVTFNGNPKLEWLARVAAELNGTVQYVVFHEFIYSGGLISKMLTRQGVTHARLYGGTRDSKQVIRDFQQGRVQVLVANSAKGGLAIDLPMADYLLFFESPCSPIIRKQAEARPMSRGTKPLTIDDIVCSNVERRILQYIADGKSLMASLGKERRSFAER